MMLVPMIVFVSNLTIATNPILMCGSNKVNDINRLSSALTVLPSSCENFRLYIVMGAVLVYKLFRPNETLRSYLPSQV